MSSKSKNKFRHWDNKLLFQGYEQVSQILAKIEEQVDDNYLPEDMPMSMIPSNIIYDISAGYMAMYEKLLEQELLEAGYPKSTNTYH